MNWEIIAVLAAAAVIAAIAHIKSKRPHYRASSQPWSINWSSGFPKSPPATATGWKIDFPAGLHHLNYVQWYKAPKLREGMTVVVRLRVTGGPFTFLENPTQPATATLLIHRKQDNMMSPGYRYYSKAMIPMTPGDHELRVPLTIDHWGDVLAAPTQDGFVQAMKEMESFGIIFGGAGGRGHGVSGTGSVELLSLSFNP